MDDLLRYGFHMHQETAFQSTVHTTLLYRAILLPKEKRGRMNE